MGDECDEYLRYLRGKRKDPSTPSLCKEKQVGIGDSEGEIFLGRSLPEFLLFSRNAFFI